ncbi:hypothetical protein JCM1841_005826 [Sporobolomyces salmonicolor]
MTTTALLAPPGAPHLGPTRLLPSPPSDCLSHMIGTPSPVASPLSLCDAGPSAYPFSNYAHSGSTASTKTLRKSLSTSSSLLERYRAGAPPPPPASTPRRPTEALVRANERIKELEAELAELRQAEAAGPGEKGEQGGARGLKRLLEQRNVLGSGSSPVLLLPPALSGLSGCPVCSEPQLLGAGASSPGWTDVHWTCLPRLGREGKVPVFALED